MTDEVAQGAPVGNDPGVAGVDGVSQQPVEPTVPAGYVPESDLNALRSTYDTKLAEMDRRLKQSEREKAMEGMTEADQLRYRAETAERQLQEEQARQSYAQRLAARAGVDPAQLLVHSSPEAMENAAFELNRQRALDEYRRTIGQVGQPTPVEQQPQTQQQAPYVPQPLQTQQPAPLPTSNGVAPPPLQQGGATLARQQPTPSVGQVRTDSLMAGESGLDDFVKTFMPKKE